MPQLPPYVTPVRLSKLHDELLAALPACRPVPRGDGVPVAVLTVEGPPPDGRGVSPRVVITVPDGVPQSAVDAVVAAHDPTTASAAEQQAAQDSTSLSDLAAAYSSALVQIANDRTAIAAALTGPNGLADAQWTGLTAAQKAERLRAVLQGILGALDNSAVRQQVTLRALRVVARRTGGG